jgi:hypothetical protein
VYGRKRKEWMKTNKTELKIQTSKIVSYNACAMVVNSEVEGLAPAVNQTNCQMFEVNGLFLRPPT